MFTIYILDVKVRAWGSLSKPFGFLLGPHIILQNQLTFGTGEEPLKGAENIIKLNRYTKPTNEQTLLRLK